MRGVRRAPGGMHGRKECVKDKKRGKKQVVSHILQKEDCVLCVSVLPIVFVGAKSLWVAETCNTQSFKCIFDSFVCIILLCALLGRWIPGEHACECVCMCVCVCEKV